MENKELKIQVAFDRFLKGSSIIHVIGLFLTFVNGWFITKVMDQENVGAYNYFLSMLQLGATIVPLGLQLYAVREANNFDQKKFKRFLRIGIISIIITSLIFGSTLVSLMKWADWMDYNSSIELAIIALIALPSFGFLTFFQSILQGRNRIAWSLIPNNIIRPVLLLLTMVTFFFTWPEPRANAMLIAFGVIITVAALLAYIKIPTPRETKEDDSQPNWIKHSIVMLPVMLLYNINERVDIIMITKEIDTEATAVYGTVFKIATLTSFGLVVLNQVMAPAIAQMYKNNKIKDLQMLIKENIRKVFVFTIVMAAGMAFVMLYALELFGKDGEDYTVGYIPFLVLMGGQLINVFVGPVGYFLLMTKNEKYAIISLVTSISLNIILNFILIEPFGILGAGIATAVAMASWNLIMLFFVIKKTKINPTVL